MTPSAVLVGSPNAAQVVCGLTLAKRNALLLRRAGVERIVVVGEGADDLDDVARAATLEEAATRLAGPVVVMHADRVYDPELVRRVLALDAKLAPIWVTRDGAADSFLYLVARADRLPEVAEGAGRLIKHGASPISADGAFSIRVDSPAARRHASSALFRSLRKRVDGPVARYLNRNLSLLVTRLVIHTPVTPNVMTVVANAIGILGVVLVFQATWESLFWGALCIQGQSILDGCDGEIARLKYKSSRFGEWFDNVTDDLVNGAYGVALGWASERLIGGAIYWWIGVGAAAAFTFYNAVVYAQLALVHRSGNPFRFRWWFQTGSGDLKQSLDRAGPAAWVARFARALARRDVFLLGFLVLAALRLPHVAVIWYGVVATVTLVTTTMHLALGGVARAREAERSAAMEIR